MRVVWGASLALLLALDRVLRLPRRPRRVLHRAGGLRVARATPGRPRHGGRPRRRDARTLGAAVAGEHEPAAADRPGPRTGAGHAGAGLPRREPAGRRASRTTSAIPASASPTRTRRERTLTGSSGRTEAWRGALGLAADRPLVGYGFGTEDRTFVDRYVFFNSNVPENSYIGILLQLGLVGLLLLLALVGRPRVAVAATGLAQHRRGCDGVVRGRRSCSPSSSRISTRPGTRPRSPLGSARSRPPASAWRRHARETHRPRRGRRARRARPDRRVGAGTSRGRGVGGDARRCSRKWGPSTRRICAASGSSPTSTAWSTSGAATTSRSSCASTTTAVSSRRSTGGTGPRGLEPPRRSLEVGGRRRPRRGEPPASTDERPRRVPPATHEHARARTAGRRDPGDAGRADRRGRAGRESHPAMEHACLSTDAHVRAPRAGGARPGVPRRHSSEAAAPPGLARDRGVHAAGPPLGDVVGRPEPRPSTARSASPASSSQPWRSHSARSAGLASRASSCSRSSRRRR